MSEEENTETPPTEEEEVAKEEGAEKEEAVEKDLENLTLEDGETKKEEEEEIGINQTIIFFKFALQNLDIDLNDPEVEAAAVKIQAAFGKKKAKE